MKKETLKSIFNFIEENDNRNTPIIWKLENNEPFTEDELNIEGNLDLSDTKIRTLPKGLKVGGYLRLLNSEISSLPDGLQVGGLLNLVYTKIRTLPKGLKVGGALIIVRTNFTNFSDDEIRDMIEPGFIRGNIYRL
jgi:hypothetical protein